jgi:hypothetical protein
MKLLQDDMSGSRHQGENQCVEAHIVPCCAWIETEKDEKDQLNQVLEEHKK